MKDPSNLPHKRPRHLDWHTFKRVDSIEYYAKAIDTLASKIYKIRTNPNEDFRPNSSAFIVFSTIKETLKAVKSLRSKIQSPLSSIPAKVSLCPDYDDLIWSNIGISANVKRLRSLFSFIVTFVLIFGWTFITGFTYSLDNLAKWQSIPGIGQYITSSQSLQYFIKSIVSPLLIVVLNLLLPVILLNLSKLQGITSQSGAQISALVKFFYFMVFQFIVYIGAGFVESYIKKLYLTTTNNGNMSTNSSDSSDIPNDFHDPQTLLIYFGNGFVAASTHFMIITVTGYAGYSLDLIQIGPLVMRIIGKLLSTTPREEYNMNEPPGMIILILVFDYMRTYAILIFTFFNCAAYILVQPVMSFIATLFFFLAFIVLKYQLHYIYSTKHETGGDWFPKVFFLICLSVIGFQLTTFAGIFVLCALKSKNSNGKVQSAICFGLACLTCIFYFFITHFVAPKAEAISSTEEDLEDLLSTSSSRTTLGSDSEERIFNPAMVKPLLSVWVRDYQEQEMHDLYSPAFGSLEEYARKASLDDATLFKCKEETYRYLTFTRRKRDSNESISS